MPGDPPQTARCAQDADWTRQDWVGFADLLHLRKWRKSVEQAQSLTFKVVFTAIISGIVGAIWLGFKSSLGK